MTTFIGNFTMSSNIKNLNRNDSKILLEAISFYNLVLDSDHAPITLATVAKFSLPGLPMSLLVELPRVLTPQSGFHSTKSHSSVPFS